MGALCHMPDYFTSTNAWEAHMYYVPLHNMAVKGVA